MSIFDKNETRIFAFNGQKTKTDEEALINVQTNDTAALMRKIVVELIPFTKQQIEDSGKAWGQRNKNGYDQAIEGGKPVALPERNIFAEAFQAIAEKKDFSQISPEARAFLKQTGGATIFRVVENIYLSLHVKGEKETAEWLVQYSRPSPFVFVGNVFPFSAVKACSRFSSKTRKRVEEEVNAKREDFYSSCLRNIRTFKNYPVVETLDGQVFVLSSREGVAGVNREIAYQFNYYGTGRLSGDDSIAHMFVGKHPDDAIAFSREDFPYFVSAHMGWRGNWYHPAKGYERREILYNSGGRDKQYPSREAWPEPYRYGWPCRVVDKIAVPA